MMNLNSETLKKRLKKALENFIDEKVFPGAVVGISVFFKNNFKRNIFFYGKIDESENTVKRNTFYDCASLTKPLVTVLSILALIEDKKIFWNDRLGSLISLPIQNDKEKISLIDLMSHSSGFPAHRPYYRYLMNMSPELRKNEVIRLILKEDLIYVPGKGNVYSDLGYILLGKIVEEKSGKLLDEFWRKKIIDPLFLNKKLMFPQNGEISKNSFASTGYCSMTNTKLSGIVHDENCRILGGVAGHAGLFGTADGILSLCEHILMGYYNKLKNFTFSNESLKFVLKKRKNFLWTLGFDTPSPESSSSGKYFSKKSIGHLGFTGTSFWIDLRKRISIVILSNRVFFGNENEKIKIARPIIHDIIMEEMFDDR